MKKIFFSILLLFSLGSLGLIFAKQSPKRVYFKKGRTEISLPGYLKSGKDAANYLARAAKARRQTISVSAVAGNPAESQPPDIYGYFFIQGKAPVGFADIDHINLGGSGEYGAGAKPPYYGQIRLKNKAQTDYKLLKPTFNGKNFSFKTKSVNGVSYEFNGTFIRLDFIEKELQDTPVLSGTLKKIKAGKAIAQGKVNFTWELGD